MFDRKLYSDKIVTAEEAIKCIKDNDRLVFSHTAAVPQVLAKALAENKDKFNNVEIYHMLTFGVLPYVQEDMKGSFRHNTNFVGANSRKAVSENRADYTPCFFYELPSFFERGELPVDIAVVQITPPDSDGNCSFSVSCDYTKPAAHAAKVVIAEMNDQMPFVGGDNFIHVSELDYIVECSQPIFEIPQPNITSVEEAIGNYCAELIEDGSTLQLGIGAIPDAVLNALKKKKDLGIHSEMFSDGVIELVESGVINGRKKTLHQGKMIANFLIGTRNFYDFVHHNPMVELYPVSYVNHPCTIMKNANLVAINSCIEVDLMGQVVSESIGSTQFSGTGGQVDFVRGASMAPNGKSIMAMPSTASKGSKSRIVPFIAQGAAVTTSRNDVEYVITEYGIARLKGKTLRERAKMLIDIAHPDFRDELTEEYNKRFPK
ncbi:MAG: 4-hydroxybutyrate CoA-transferase [Prevotella sp.]|jgi:4-hydroxybutyrate CoA-transferase|nr:4-hydroxybutyrate CoA-transferase [Prevotella sp.]